MRGRGCGVSATIVYLSPSAAHLLTDGAGFDSDGRPQLVLHKVHLIPHMGAAITARGPYAFFLLLQLVLGAEQGGFDDLVPNLPTRADQALRMLAAGVSAEGATMAADIDQIDMALIGWSRARSRAEAYLIERRPDGRWEVTALDNGGACQYATPADQGLVDRLLAAGVDLWAQEANPAEHGLAVMREQKRSSAGLIDAPLASFVGGFCQLTTITADLALSRILERWHLVDPTSAAV